MLQIWFRANEYRNRSLVGREMAVVEVHGSGEGVEEDVATAIAIRVMGRERLRRGGDDEIYGDLTT
jgi:hypothetical protein